MRVTQSMYFKSIYGENNTQLNKKLFDVNRQIASGISIQYAKDDIQTFTDTMRLDNEITILGQIKTSVDSGYKVSNQADVTLNDFETSLNRMNTLLLQGANDTNSETSRDAIAKELRQIESHFKDLANTSINGKYLFSGSAVDTRPITDDGIYMGNSDSLDAFTGSHVTQQYNVSGTELFLGENSKTNRVVSTNVIQQSNAATSLNGSTTMAEFMGDVTPLNDHYFYVSGTKSDGTTFREQLPVMSDASTIDNLLEAIGTSFGNTGTVDVVNVSMNSSGQIIVEDKIKGSSKLDFHIVGATDFSGGGAANVNDITLLDGAETDYNIIAGPPIVAGLYVKEFVRSPYTSATAGIANIDALLYDRTQFTKDGGTLTSNIPQLLKSQNTSVKPYIDLDKNAFAEPSTKISDVADLQTEIVPVTVPKTYTLIGKVLNLEGTDINGIPYTASVNFDTSPPNINDSTFTINGFTYDMFNADASRSKTSADDMTYQQLMDVINMAVTDNPPAAAPGLASDYDSAIEDSKLVGNTSITYDGKIEFTDLRSANTNASIALYDSTAGDFTVGAESSMMTFNSNNSIKVRDPKTDFFKTIDEVISSVENYKNNADASSGNMRDIGIQNGIQAIEDIQDHIFKIHSNIGANSNALSTSLERSELLELSTMTLRSSVIDTDLASASLKLTQLSLNYEAMLSTVGKVSRLSLVNYL
ncbi:flagellar biosynthesis protein FlgL [Sulfurimonas sp.]|nr:flagellar biosynthesis protein FlgL [Sulfurimonas sp.]